MKAVKFLVFFVIMALVVSFAGGVFTGQQDRYDYLNP